MEGGRSYPTNPPPLRTGLIFHYTLCANPYNFWRHKLKTRLYWYIKLSNHVFMHRQTMYLENFRSLCCWWLAGPDKGREVDLINITYCRPRVTGLARLDEKLRGAFLLWFQISVSWESGMHWLLHKVMTLEFMYAQTLKHSCQHGLNKMRDVLRTSVALIHLIFTTSPSWWTRTGGCQLGQKCYAEIYVFLNRKYIFNS